ncbi:MAG: BF2992 family fimbrillin-A clan protein [Tannerellaceae bacterium]
MTRNPLKLLPSLCLGLLLCCAATSCTGGLVEEAIAPDDEAELIALRFNTPALGLSTRAVTTAPLPEGSTVRIAAYRRAEVGTLGAEVDFATTQPYAEATYVTDASGNLSPCTVDEFGRLTSSTGTGLAVSSGVFDFYAVSPARPLAQGGGTWQISGIPHQEDVMASATRSVTITHVSRQVALTSFIRKCAQVVFTVSPPTGADAVLPDNLKATALTLTLFSTSGASLTAGSDIVPTGGDATPAGTLTFTESDFVPVASGSDPNNLGLNQASRVVLPKDATPFDLSVTVTHNSKVETLAATGVGAIALEAGKRYIFILEVASDRCLLTLNVVDWIPVNLTDNNVGGK